MKKIIALLCVILFAFSLVACESDDPETNYNKALEYLEKGEYEKAHRLLYELGDYKDAAEYLGKFRIYYKKCNVKRPNDSFKLDFKYDDFGNMICSDSFRITKDGIEVFENAITCGFEYDENGRITKRIEGESYYNVYIYDSEGKLLKWEEWRSEKTDKKDKNKEPVLVKTEYVFYRDEFEYDENGNLIKETYYDTEGNVSQITENAYNSNGKLQSVVIYSGEDIIEKYELEYDDNGNLIKFVVVGTSVTEYVYNEASVVVESISKSVETDTPIRKDEYDSAGNIIKTTEYDETGKPTSIKEFVYDSFGKITGDSYYDGEGNVEWESKYEYDKNGNLTEKEEIIHGAEKTSTFTFKYSGFVYFYYPDGIPEITGDDPYYYEDIDHYNLGKFPMVHSFEYNYVRKYINN